MMKIEAKNLYFSYGDQPVLNGVNITLTSQQPVVLLGGSGMGKTTLLRLLAGLIPPKSGQIKGIDEHTRIAVMYQEDRLFPHLTIYKKSQTDPSRCYAKAGCRAPCRTGAWQRRTGSAPT